MMRGIQSSPATEHRFCRIIGGSDVAGQHGYELNAICDPCDPCVTHTREPMGHSFSVVVQWLDHAVTHVTHKCLKSLGDDIAAAGQRMSCNWAGYTSQAVI